MLWALATARLAAPEAVMEEVKGMATDGPPQAVANVLWASSRLSALLPRLVLAAEGHVEAFDPQGLAAVVSALASQRDEHTGAAAGLLKAAARRLQVDLAKELKSRGGWP